MVADEEHQLKLKEQTEEKEKNKFIEIVSDNENEIVSQAQKEVQNESKQGKKEFIANVYDNYDATTGLKIEENTVDTLSQSAIKEAEQQQTQQTKPANENSESKPAEQQNEKKESKNEKENSQQNGQKENKQKEEAKPVEDKNSK